jgi:prophage regulatory protein
MVHQDPHEFTPTAIDATPMRRLMRLPECLQATAQGRSAFLNAVKAKQAPQPIKIGRATMWVQDEIAAYIESRIKASRGGQ